MLPIGNVEDAHSATQRQRVLQSTATESVFVFVFESAFRDRERERGGDVIYCGEKKKL
jgi:hypothetical protein